MFIIQLISEMIKAILFDFTQTLVDSSRGFRLAEKRVKRNLFKYLGLKDWNKFLKKYRQIRSDSLLESIFSKKILWQNVCWSFKQGEDKTLFENWEYDYWKLVNHNTHLFPETLDAIIKLSKTHELGIITNAQHQPNELRSHSLDQFKFLESYFQSIIIAGENKIEPKPKRRPFDICLNQLGVKAYESIYVGDDWINDILGSKEAGLQPVWIQHHTVKRIWPKAQFLVPKINSLDQLLQMSLIK